MFGPSGRESFPAAAGPPFFVEEDQSHAALLRTPENIV
jgi:hypothetical protein